MKYVEKARRRTASPLLSLFLLGMLSLLTDNAPAIGYGGASFINVFPSARAQAFVSQNTVANSLPDTPADALEPSARLKKIGERRAIVFSPDFAASGNREFYEALGFAYWESPNWRKVLKEIKQFNSAHKEDGILEIFFETHGSNGNGLKLQQSKLRSAPRSYISLGALQEHLGEAGVKRAILAACNTGRLYRPEIYTKLNMSVKDPTVLPATLGVINASPNFTPSSSAVELVRRTESRMEQTSEGRYNELSEPVRRALGLPSSSRPFTVSNMFIQMIVKDARLQLTNNGYVRELSDQKESDPDNESIFQSFLKFLDNVVSG